MREVGATASELWTEEMEKAWQRGRSRAAAELAKIPPDDGMVTVSVPDRAKVEREHFRLCRTCGRTRGKLGRCTCPRSKQ